MEKYCFLNNKIIETSKARVSVTDIGLLRGFGVFEFMRTYNGKPFLFEKHMKRFKNSSRLAGLTIPKTDKEIRNIIDKLVKKNKVSEIGVDLILTGGESSDGLSWNPERPTFYILLNKLMKISPEVYEKGVKLITYPYHRDISSAKTINYVTKLSLDSKKQREGAFEILYTKNEKILEGSTCNFFVFKNNTLITPKEDILLGTRRWLVLNKLAKQFKIEERSILIKELGNIDEAFITSTSRNIIPVTQIDNIKIGTGHVGPKTKALMELFDDYVRKHTNN